MQKKNKIDWKAYGHKLVDFLKSSGKALYHHPVLLILVVLLTGAVWCNKQNGSSDTVPYQGTQVAMHSPLIGQLELIQMSQGGAKACGYSITQNETLSVKKPFRQTQVELYQVAGTMSLMAVPLFAGAWPDNSATQCVIDKETSYALFGDFDGTGNTLLYNDKKYEVAGIVDSSIPTAYLYNGDLTCTYDLFLLQGSEEEKNAALDTLPAEQILSKVEYQQVNEAVTYLRSLPLWFGVLLLGIVVILHCRKHYPAIAVTVLLGILLLYLSGFHFYLPEIFIPERWSRLEFYPEAVANLKDAVYHYLQMIKGSFEGQYFINIIRTFFATVVLVLLEVAVAVRLGRRSR